MKISVLYNKPTERFAEHAAHWEAEEDTEESAQEVADALETKGVQTRLVPITEHTIDATVASLTGDLVFNLIEWTGIDTKYAMQTFDLMDAKHLRYTGATKDNYLLTCDKSLMKKRLEELRLPTARWQLYISGDEPIRTDFHYPVIVKVSSEHSSVGLSKEAVVENEEALRDRIRKCLLQYKQPVYAEEFLSGREFQVTLLEMNQKLFMLPPSEIIFTKTTDVPFLTYESRWDMTHPDYNNSNVTLAAIEPKLALMVESMSRAAFRSLGFRDYARFDIRCSSDSTPYFLEVNSNPGLGDDPEYGMTVSYKAICMSFADFVWKIVESALRRRTV